MPCAAGVEGFLADEVRAITGLTGHDLLTGRGGVMARASWRDAMRINLHSRLTQRVLVQLSVTDYRNENDLYNAASEVAWRRPYADAWRVPTMATANASCMPE